LLALLDARRERLGALKTSCDITLSRWWWWWRWAWWRWTWWRWTSTIGADTGTLNGLACCLTTHGIASTKGSLVSGWRADESALLVTRGRLESTLRCGGHTRWHIGRAGGRCAVRRAEGASKALDLDGLLIRLTAISWVAVVGLGSTNENHLCCNRDINHHEGWNTTTAAEWKLRVELLDARAAGREVFSETRNA